MPKAQGPRRRTEHSTPRRPRRGLEPRLQALEERNLLSAPVAPTADEQYMLELINRARANPAAEGQRLLQLAQTDPLIHAATGNWDMNLFYQLISSHGPLPPLAFNPGLIEAARDHNQVMLAVNDQVHSPKGYLTNPAVATASNGQAFYPVGNAQWATGENIFGYGQNVRRPTVQDYLDYYHAGFMIDWGNLDFSHLENILAPGPAEAATAGHFPYSEVGIGVLANAVPTIPPAHDPGNMGQSVGPVLVTEEFGWRSDGNAFLTGVAYDDLNENNFYDPGEGLGSVVITAVGRAGQGTFQTQTWDSGGYSLPLPPGTYDVTARGNLPAPQSTVITIGADNVLWDLRIDPSQRADLPVPGAFSAGGHTEVAAFRPSTAQWILPGASAPVQFGAPNLDLPVPGSYDVPGHTEIAVYRPTTAQWFIQGPTGTRVVSFGAPNLDIPVPGDYDGDGRTDMAVYRPTTAQWFIWGSSAGPKVVKFGAPNLDIPVPGDYDHTGHLELALYRPTTAQWLILSPSGPRAVSFGQPGVDIPVPGDYDGDGRTDIAVYRPTTAQWFILGSSAGPEVFQFGAPNLDIPVPGNYDGLGRSELAVYRPTTAQWFITTGTKGHITQLGQGGLYAPLSLSDRTSVVSLGTQTSRFGIA
jgi:hypothetical protein